MIPLDILAIAQVDKLATQPKTLRAHPAKVFQQLLPGLVDTGTEPSQTHAN